MPADGTTAALLRPGGRVLAAGAVPDAQAEVRQQDGHGRGSVLRLQGGHLLLG